MNEIILTFNICLFFYLFFMDELRGFYRSWKDIFYYTKILRYLRQFQIEPQNLISAKNSRSRNKNGAKFSCIKKSQKEISYWYICVHYTKIPMISKILKVFLKWKDKWFQKGWHIKYLNIEQLKKVFAFQ